MEVLGDQGVPVHKNDKFLIAGDCVWFCWTLYGMAIGVPLIWGCISLAANLLSVFLLLNKYRDKEWAIKGAV